MLDTSINGALGATLLAYAWYSLAPYSAERFFSLFDGLGGSIGDLIFTYIIAALVGGPVVGSTGTSIGKSIFGIRVVNSNMQTIGIGNGLRREFAVWLKGLGLGIPIVSLFTMLNSYDRLRKEGTARWDAGRNVVLYRPGGTYQTVLNVLGIIMIILVIGALRDLNRML